MSWLTTTLLVVASACLTLAAIHAHVWMRHREAGAHAAFAALAASVAGLALVELRMVGADTLEQFGRMLWWYQVPVWTAVAATVLFVRRFLRAGKAWLGWTAVGLRTLAFGINFFSSPSINYRELNALEKVALFGDPVSVVQGVPNPWMAVGQLSLVVLIAFVADAARELWRRGDRRRAVTVGGSLALFVTAGTLMAVATFWGMAKMPIFASLFFLPIVIAMGSELGLDLIRGARLAAELSAKKAELSGSEAKLALAADAVNAGLWSVDGATGRLWATPRALTMFGLATDRAYHLDDVLASIHPGDRERARDWIESAHRAEGRSSIEYRVVDARGETRWYMSLGRATDGDVAGRPGLTGVTIDITERKQAEDETTRQRVELEHLSRVASLSELSGALAHEINQPLAIIMSNAEAAQRLLAQPAPDFDEVRAILRDIVGADERAGEVIGRLRRLLKRGSPNPQPLPLNERILAVLQFMRGDLIRRGVAVELSLAERLPDICADPISIEQVLINVIGNACDAMTANDPGDRNLKIETCVDTGMVQARIVDAGSGLPEPPERVFTPFYTTKREGLGLGLAISRSIVTAHGGRLRVKANAARGATFLVDLPVAAEVK